MTDIQKRFVDLERQREGAKQFFKDLDEATQAVADELGGADKYFKDDENVVYKIVAPKGRWVNFETISYVRTRREGEEKGSLSLKEALAAGFGPF